MDNNKQIKLKKFKYKTRLIDSILFKTLNNIGAVLIEGPKWCGKTWSALNIAKSVFYMQSNPKINIEIANTNPNILLEGEKPRLIDEWQIAPNLWDVVRYRIDLNPTPNQFILTGCTSIHSKKTFHSGAGRILRINLATMTLFETNDSEGLVSLQQLKKQEILKQYVCKKKFDDITNFMCKGGWPQLTFSDKNLDYNFFLSSYLDGILKHDQSSKNSDLLLAILKSIARNISCPVNETTIFKDVVSYLSSSLNIKTFKKYLNYLKNIFIVDFLSSYSFNVRSKSRLTVKPKIYFCDVSIGLFLLELSAEKLKIDLNTYGLYFENLVYHDLKVYCDFNQAKLYYYRDNNGFEVDFVIEFNDGKWAAVEAKLTAYNIDLAANNLIKFKKRMIDTKQKGNPVFLAVISTFEYFYQRPDGVFVIPIQALKP